MLDPGDWLLKLIAAQCCELGRDVETLPGLAHHHLPVENAQPPRLPRLLPHDGTADIGVSRLAQSSSNALGDPSGRKGTVRRDRSCVATPQAPVPEAGGSWCLRERPYRRAAQVLTPSGASASSAKVRMSGTVMSGVALASGVAPKPDLAWRRLIQTVLRPSCLAGTWSW
jgi:hypothetical protein